MRSNVYLEGRFFGKPGSWFAGHGLVKTLQAKTVQDLPSVIELVESFSKQGLTCAGFVPYESACAFSSEMPSGKDISVPYAWFQCFESFELVVNPFGCPPSAPKFWNISVTEDQFVHDIALIKEYLAAGDTYQVNYTFRLQSNETDGHALMARLIAAQPDSYSAYFDTGDHVVCSVSPELFLAIDGDQISTRPMKGTRPRGRTQETDEALVDNLRKSKKDQAENLMIVDMARNDLGRIAEVGSVRVPDLFTLETHKTLHQLTSGVHATTDASLLDVFKATFPPASITGAPKVRTMEIIDELEDPPRGIYTGCIGVFGPGRKGAFSVAIRTATVDTAQHCTEYGIGAGIVWDSGARTEWDECLLKSAVLGALDANTRLIETFRYERPAGYFLLDRHLGRLTASAQALGFECDVKSLRDELSQHENEMTDGLYKVRLLLSPDGSTELSSSPLVINDQPLRIAVLENAIDSSNQLLRHKTTLRTIYEEALALFPECDEVVLTNERGEVTEGCITNVLIEIEGRWYTPPVSSGLLPGTLRQELIESGEVSEQVITVEDMKSASRIQVVNSVRGRADVNLAVHTPS